MISRNRREGYYAGKCRGEQQRWKGVDMKKRYSLPNEYFAWVVWNYKQPQK